MDVSNVQNRREQEHEAHLEDLQFSWSDSLKACLSSTTSILPSISSNKSSPKDGGEDREQSNRLPSGELERLLEDPESDTDALSLHSNIHHGSSARRLRGKKSRRKGGRGKGVFGECLGFSLFGRRNIKLTEDSSGGEDVEGGWVVDVDGGDMEDALQTSAFDPVDSLAGPQTPVLETTLDTDSSPTPLTSSRIEELSRSLSQHSPLMDKDIDTGKKNLESKKSKSKSKSSRSNTSVISSQPSPLNLSFPTPSTIPFHPSPPTPSSPPYQPQHEPFGPFIAHYVQQFSQEALQPLHLPANTLQKTHGSEDEEDEMDFEATSYAHSRPRSSTLNGTRTGSGSESGSRSTSKNSNSYAVKSVISGSTFRSRSSISGTNSTSATSEQPDLLSLKLAPGEAEFEGFDGGELTLPTPEELAKKEQEKREKRERKERRRIEKELKKKKDIFSNVTVTSGTSGTDSTDSPLSPGPILNAEGEEFEGCPSF